MTNSPRRFPRSVYDRGEEPDARFSLANERTFLAWITTGLALLSAGVALHALVPNMNQVFARPAEILLILAGLACPLQAWLGWAGVERAIREGRPLPTPKLGLLISIVLTAVGLLVLAGVLVR